MSAIREIASLFRHCEIPRIKRGIVAIHLIIPCFIQSVDYHAQQVALAMTGFLFFGLLRLATQGLAMTAGAIPRFHAKRDESRELAKGTLAPL